MSVKDEIQAAVSEVVWSSFVDELELPSFDSVSAFLDTPMPGLSFEVAVCLMHRLEDVGLAESMTTTIPTELPVPVYGPYPRRVGMRMKDVAEKLRSALITQAPIHNQRMPRGELCWCYKGYDVDKYGHSIACAAAKEALAAHDELKGS